MFGPALPIHVRLRIYRRRLSYAAGVAAVMLGAAILFMEYEPDAYAPPQVGRRGVPLIVTNIDEIREEIADRDLFAGGHPLPKAMQAVEIELELTHEAPDVTIEERAGEEAVEIPEIEEPRPGPTIEEQDDSRDAAPLSIRSQEIVVLKFVKPLYPADAKLLGIEGLVTVTAAVGADGEVTDVIARTEDDILPSCVKAARLAIMEWRFAPRMHAGIARPFHVRIPVRFTLERGVQAGT